MVKRKENIHWRFLAQETAGELELLFLEIEPADALALKVHSQVQNII